MIRYLYKDWHSIVSILISVLCYWLGELNEIKPEETPPGIFSILNANTYNCIVHNKGWLLFFMLVILFVIQIFHYHIKQAEQRQWLKSFLEHITNQHLSGGNYDTRITIFRKRRGWRFYLQHLLRKMSAHSIKNQQSPNIRKQYLCIYLRYCSIEHSKSYPYFDINDGSDTQNESIVSECFRTGSTISRRTKSIKDIHLKKDFEGHSKAEKKRISKYMDDLGISDYSTLLKINTPSNSLLAMPIQHGEKRWGVIVFDNINDPENEPMIFENKISTEFIASYQKIVQFTTKLIK